MENNFKLMNLKERPELLTQIQKWEQELHEKTGDKVALIAYEGRLTGQLHKKELG